MNNTTTQTFFANVNEFNAYVIQKAMEKGSFWSFFKSETKPSEIFKSENITVGDSEYEVATLDKVYTTLRREALNDKDDNILLGYTFRTNSTLYRKAFGMDNSLIEELSETYGYGFKKQGRAFVFTSPKCLLLATHGGTSSSSGGTKGFSPSVSFVGHLKTCGRFDQDTINTYLEKDSYSGRGESGPQLYRNKPITVNSPYFVQLARLVCAQHGIDPDARGTLSGFIEYAMVKLVCDTFGIEYDPQTTLVPCPKAPKVAREFVAYATQPDFEEIEDMDDIEEIDDYEQGEEINMSQEDDNDFIPNENLDDLDPSEFDF